MRTQKFEENKIDITLEKFDELEGKHEFSGQYNRKKEVLLDAVRKRERAAKKTYYRVAVAAVLALILIPTTAFAAAKLYNVNVEKKGFRAVIKVEKDKDALKGNEKFKLVPTKVEFTYLPEGCVQDPYGEKYGIPEEADCAHAITPSGLWEMDENGCEVSVDYTIKQWDYATEDRKVMVFQKDDTFEFNKEVYVYFTEYGYVQSMYLGYGISDEEVKKIAEGLQVTETREEKVVQTADSDDAAIQDEKSAVTHVGYESKDFADWYNTWYEMGEEVQLDYGYRYKVTDVQVMDDIRQVDKEYFDDMGREMLEKYADKNGVFVPYERKNIIPGDGVNTVNRYAEPEMIRKKLVYVTLEFTGGSEEETCALYQLRFLKSKTEMDYDEWNFKEAVYFDASPRNNTDRDYFFFALGEGEKKTCHLGFIIDEDKLDLMYLDSSHRAEHGQFVDIR